MSDQSVPKNNVRGFGIMFKVEVGLREFIIDKLQGHAGPRWWKQRLPSDVLASYRAGRDYERAIKWLNLVPLHPIYYIEFSDLRKIIERRDNWVDVFEHVFGSNPWVSNSLQELQPIRNRIAHNRPITLADVQIAESALRGFALSIGEQQFDQYVASVSSAPSVVGIFSELRTEAREAIEACRQFQRALSLGV